MLNILANYHRWAYRALYQTVDQLPDERYRKDIGLFFKSIHGTHHRGQISVALTQLGCEAPVLDLIYFNDEL